jgi:hypothetical protein
VSNTSFAFHGLGYHITTPTTDEWQELDPSEDPEIRSITKDANGADLTLGMANFIEDIVLFRRQDLPKGGADKSLIVCPIGQKSRLKHYLNSYRQADMSATVLKTGGQEVENQWGNRWEEDPLCPDTRIFHLYEPSFSMLTLGKGLGFADTKTRDNMILRHSTETGADVDGVFDGWFELHLEFISREPGMQAMIHNLGVSKIYKAATYTRSV